MPKHKAAPPRADIITQRELQEILDRYNALGWDILEIRKRREAGVEIEPGEYTAHSNAKGDPIDNYDGEPPKEDAFYNFFGLDLETKKVPNASTTEVAPQHEDEDDEEEDLDWIEKTPEIEYRLIADGTNVAPYGRWLQCVDVTRDEYIALKADLAKLRGYQVSEQEAN